MTDLAIGDHLRVADIVAPEGVTILDDPETLIVVMATPAAVVAEVEEVEEVQGEEAGAPEERHRGVSR